MKILLILVSLFVTPVYAAFDFGKLLEGVVGEAAQSILTPQKEQQAKQQPTTTREGYILNGGVNADRYNEIHYFFAKKVVVVAPSNHNVVPYIDNVKKYCPEKFDSKICQFSQEQVDVMKGQKIRLQLAKIITQLKRDRPTYSSQKSLSNFVKAEDLIEQYKSGGHVNDRTIAEINRDHTRESQYIETRSKEKQQAKQNELAKAAEEDNRKWVNNNLSQVMSSPFKPAYDACLAEGDKLIAQSKLLNSASFTPSKVDEAKQAFKRTCGCVYVRIYTNSTSASAKDIKALSDDLVRIEGRKFKDSGRKVPKWEVDLFNKSLNNAETAYLAFMDGVYKCD